MGHDEEHLLAADLLFGQQSVLAVTDLRSQAVYGFVARQHPVYDCPAVRDHGPDAVREFHSRAVDDGDQVLEGKRFLRDCDGAHGKSLKQRY
jgi:hypothetical protein